MSDTDPLDAGVPLLESPSPSRSPSPANGTKRKRTDDATAEPAPLSKRAAKRSKRTKKPKDITDDALDLEAGVNHAVAHMDSQLLADHLAQRTARFQPDLSLMELDELRVPATAILDTSAFSHPRDLASLPTYLETYATGGNGRKKKGKGRKLSDAPEAKGSPHTLVVAMAGLRCADLTRALRQFQTKDAMVAKLFAKHIKLGEAVTMVRATRMGIGVGTPARIAELVKLGALDVGALERVLVDASHIDLKKRGILDVGEIQVPLARLLRGLTATKEGGEREVQVLFF